VTRIVKAHAVRREEILVAAQRLLYARGYEQMTIQEILDDLQIAKGTFYHYFDSKQALLEALTERMGDELGRVLHSVAHDPRLPALDKLDRFFTTLAQWKSARKEVILALLRVWYADDNALVRQKRRAATVQRNEPMLTAIIHQGIQEGVMATRYPDYAGAVVMSIVLDLSDTVAAVVLSTEPRPDALLRLEGTIAAYTYALERALGIPAGSVHLVDLDTLKEWIVAPGSDT
jgi:AcrR family transcriptional regulator